MEYKSTLNLPKTDFPIRPNLAKVEEDIESHWLEINIYRQMLEKNQGREKYILHDGPPYPNGDIHLGHALNKVLKDFVVKYKNLAGFYAPYVPGWDCHGLPIETQLLKEIRKSGDQGIGDKIEFRKKCKDYALKYVDIQRREFKKLGVFGDWDNPYLTLDFVYEAKIVEVFGKLAERGYIYRGLKPIHWCPHCETALAEAEIEYEDEKSPSIYVKFQIPNPNFQTIIKTQLPNLPMSFIIWTTTPWTLPANVAIAAHPDYEYVFLKAGSEIYILAEGLLEDFIKHLEIKDHKVLGKTKGKFLEGTIAQHPFILREVPLVLDELVTLEEGTGLVHIAPGHGEEDYQVGLKYKLPTVMPVNDRGYFDGTVPEFIAGKYYDEANKLITERMKQDGTLLKLEFIKHSYPHCWRCKKPVIFRATEQWFISVDHNNLRQNALAAISKTNWYPSWGENRIRGMIESRPDWCISRQRTWGVPIPAFYCLSCGQPQTTGTFNEAIRKLFAQAGSDAWFKMEAKDILPPGTKCPKCSQAAFKKETDILDVWFESGSSHAAVLDGPADLYLEGSDQHRGWFQSSLLIAMGHLGHAPYQAVLTHGFTIDDSGKKMSKSLGNVVDPQAVVLKYGADVLRLWVASTDFRADMAASEKILKQVQEAYLKIRNTCRFLLSNLFDWNRDVQSQVPYNKLLEVDRYILSKLQKLIQRILKAYDEFEFHVVYHSIYSFCVNDLSALYLDLSKDRLYCGGTNALDRRSAQTVMDEILKALIKLLAPILSYTTEDIHKYYRGSGSVFLLKMPKVNQDLVDDKLEEKWEVILKYRQKAYQVLEEARNNKIIAASLEAQVELFAEGNELNILKSVEADLPMIYIVSGISLSSGSAAPKVSPAAGKKCERCWTYKTSVGENSTHPTLCDRCASVVTAKP
jgi:isoleucyl-tRNA synthetase